MNDEFKNIIESLIFASDEELSVKQISDILGSFNKPISATEIENIIDKLNFGYKANGNAFRIIKVAGGYQFATRKEYAFFVGKLFTERQKKKLSTSSLETLAIIAYKQPRTRAEREGSRGVNGEERGNAGLERDLINSIGRAESPGKPILYGTTKNVLKVLGINSVEELPKLREINDILKNEKIEGLTEEDIDLFNSINSPDPTSKNENDTENLPINFDQRNDNDRKDERNDEVE